MKKIIIIVILICLTGTAIAGTTLHLKNDNDIPSSNAEVYEMPLYHGQRGSNSGINMIISNPSDGFDQGGSGTGFPGGGFMIYVSDGYLFICANVDIEFIEGPYRDPDTFIIFWFIPDVKIIYYLPDGFFDEYPYVTFPDLPLVRFPQYDDFIPITWPPVDTIEIGLAEKIQHPPLETIQIPPLKTIQIDPIDVKQRPPIVWKNPDSYWVKPLTE